MTFTLPTAADQSRHMAMQMSMQQNPAMGGKQQAPSQMFKVKNHTHL